MIRNSFSYLMLSSVAALVSVCMMVSPSWPNRLHSTNSSDGFVIQNPAPARATLSPDEATKQSIKQAYGRLPLQFIENNGQADSRVAYYAQDGNTNIYFASEGVTLSLTSAVGPKSGLRDSLSSALGLPVSRAKTSRRTSVKQRWALKLDFVGSNPDVRPRGADQTASVVSYFSGSQAKSNAQTYKGLIYENLWPNIDLLYAGASNRLKYTFVVRPGGDVNQIRLICRGATSAHVSSEGRLQVDTPLGSITDDQPYSYQDSDGQPVNVAMQYELEREADNYVYGFRPGSYDKSKTLVIDPVVLVYCGYVGGTKNDEGFDIAIDANHNAYITGSTDSGAKSFPVTAGPDLDYNGGDSDAFVAKINSEGSELIYCSYIGGSKFDAGISIAVDGVGNAYVTGDTNSKTSSFPVTVGPDLKFNGELDTFVAKINTSGTALIYCGYIGGESCDFSGGIAVDKTGSAYVFGQTFSNQSTFPVTIGPDLTFNSTGEGCDEDSPDDCFVAKINVSGATLDYCGYIGGMGADEAFFGDIAVDDAGSAYVAGRTDSDESTFPVMTGPDLTYNGRDDVFVAKINASGASLDYCGYIGGDEAEGGRGSYLAIDNAGNAYVFADTVSSPSSFPLTVGPDLIKNGRQVVFVAKVNASGTTLGYCGYIESSDGSDHTAPGGIAVDAAGNAYVFGNTNSPETVFPVRLGPELKYNSGDFDTFVAKINTAGTALIYCGYIGGGRTDMGEDGGIAVDESGDVYVVGSTDSLDGTFPVTVGPGLEFNDGDSDAFVAKISMEHGFSLQPVRRVIGIGRGKETDLIIHIARDEGFTDSITITPQNPDEKGVKLTPGERISTTDNDIKFTLKVKPKAATGVRRLFFTGRTLSGVEHTSAVTIDVTKR